MHKLITECLPDPHPAYPFRLGPSFVRRGREPSSPLTSSLLPARTLVPRASFRLPHQASWCAVENTVETTGEGPFAPSDVDALILRGVKHA